MQRLRALADEGRMHADWPQAVIWLHDRLLIEWLLAMRCGRQQRKQPSICIEAYFRRYGDLLMRCVHRPVAELEQNIGLYKQYQLRNSGRVSEDVRDS